MRVLFFSAVISLGSVLLFGLVPALRVLRIDIAAGLKGDAGAEVGQPGGLPLGKALVAAQVALSVVLLFGAGLFVRTLVNLRNVDAGFHPEHVVTFGLSLPRAYSRVQQGSVSQTFVKTLRTDTGIAAASAAMPGAFTSSRWDGTFEIVGQIPNETKKANLLAVDTGFFSVLRIPMLAGRNFAPQDTAGAPNVVVINEAMATTYFGSRIRWDRKFSNKRRRPRLLQPLLLALCTMLFTGVFTLKLSRPCTFQFPSPAPMDAGVPLANEHGTEADRGDD
jgi:ABC-type antimicrobial peptide transport system permease subunit